MISTETPCDEFSSRFGPAYGNDWSALVTDLTEDEDERLVVEALRAVLRGGDRFRQPVRVDTDDSYVTNGCHRVVASILEHVPVRWVEDGAVDSAQPEFFGDELEVELVVSGSPEDDIFDRAASRLRSFPLDDELWVESCGFGARPVQTETVFSGIWYCPEARADELIAELTERVTALGLSLRSLTCKLFDPEAEEL